MFKYFFFFCLSLFFLKPIFSQFEIKGKILIDGTSESIPFANIVLYQQDKDSVLQYASSNLDGLFLLTKIPSGVYKLQIDFIGMQSKIIDSLKVYNNLNLGAVYLKNGVELEVIEINLKKPEAEVKIDRKTFNVSENQASVGGTAVDILNTLPSIDVDEDGTVSLRGSSNLRILIDGKPTGLSGDNIGLILKQIPANTIEDIEIITVPSAKYDAESSGGIINIVLKKNKKAGTNAGINLSYGNFDKINTSLSGGYKSEKLDIGATYGLNTGKFWSDRKTNTFNSTIDSLEAFNTTSNGWSKSPSHLGKIELSYRPDSINEFGIGSSISYGLHRDMDKINYDWIYDNSSINSLRFTENNSKSINLTSSLNYKRNFSKKSYLKFTSSHAFHTDNELGRFNEEGVLQDESNTNQSNEFIQNLDLMLPLKPLKLEAGGQHTHRIIAADFTFNDHFLLTQINNNFDYWDDISALYLVGSKQIKSWAVMVGYRTEYTHSQSENLSTNLNLTRFYFNHFPSLSLSKKLNSNNELGVNYSKRIMRPNAHQLNPSTSLSDPFTIRTGNPNLTPALIDVAELNWIVSSKALTVSTTAFYQYNKDRIRRVRLVNDQGVANIQWVNYKREDYYGLEFFITWKIKKILSTNFTINAYERITDGSNIDPSFVANYYGWDAKINSTLQLPKNFSIQVNGEYKSEKTIVVGTIFPRYFLDFSIQKRILKEKGKIGFRIADIFNTKQFEVYSKVNNWESNGEYKRESRIFFLSFSYDIGKQSETKKVKKEINSSDDN